MKKPLTVLVFGANGFIGHHLVRLILERTNWKVIATDVVNDRIKQYAADKRFEWQQLDIQDAKAVEELVKRCDVVLPLAGIATPKVYIENPLRVYEIDFEANLVIVRLCATYGKRIIWPSTSEVYGMSNDAEFHPETSNLVMGPIQKPRWIYATAKQLMDRIVWALGRDKGLQFTIFRPFNFIGSGQDNLNDTNGTPRVVTQFLGNILRGEDLRLVDGGQNRRSFTDIEDGVMALIKIIENPGGIADGKVYNIGNPANNHSIREVADAMLDLAPHYPVFRDKTKRVKIVNVTSGTHYGEGYQDMSNRIPYIENIVQDLNWQPTVTLRESLERTFAFYAKQLAKKPGAKKK